jgi:hypothetical protein
MIFNYVLFRIILVALGLVQMRKALSYSQNQLIRAGLSSLVPAYHHALKLCIFFILIFLKNIFHK